MIHDDPRQTVKLLVLSSLYPNSIQTRHGVFVEERLRSLVASGAIQARVIAPVPWFPFKHARYGRYADFAAVPARETRHGIEITHPRYPVIPKIGMSLGPALLAAFVMPAMKRMLADGYDFDVIDAHYFYPDGVAATRLGRRLGKPVVITARGSDINIFPQFRTPRKQIVDAAHQSATVITVSHALRDNLIALGVSHDKITTLRNGVDLQRFAPIARNAAAAGLEPVSFGSVGQDVWLSVGNLIKSKGVDIAVKAIAQVPDAILLIAGTGPEATNLRRLASSHGVDQRVHFLGLVPHDDLSKYFNAADVLVLPSESEGMPNVVLEAMACGTPVVATPVGGVPELLTVPEAGRLMSKRTPEALVAAVSQLMQDYPDPQATRAHANHFSWEETTQGQLAIFHRILAADGVDMTLKQPGAKLQ